MAYNEPAKADLVGYAPNDQASYNTQAGVTIKPDLRYDVTQNASSNGIPLCEVCNSKNITKKLR